MAAPKNKAQSVASAQWVQSERDQARQFIDEEVEEFSFSVRNELEWLDEHMGDIFSRNQMYVYVEQDMATCAPTDKMMQELRRRFQNTR